MMDHHPQPRKRRINLALQGGGAHGAFTWGVLERLLEDDEIEISGISGTSAGALNAAALKVGLATGGVQGALDQLSWVWTQMGAISDLRFTSWLTAFWPAASLVARMTETAMMFSPGELIAQVASPYSYGPLYVNPLQRVVAHLNLADAHASGGPELFISATNVRTGKIRVFSGDQVTADVILASACLPTMFQAVEVDDPESGRREAYWDGGYAGNPALFPLFRPSLPDDIVIVNINPMLREMLPYTPLEIENRINEISFNASLLSELRAIAFVQKLIADGKVAEGAMKNVRLHMIADDDLMNNLSATTKLLPTPFFLNGLREAGRRAAEKFLNEHKSDLNQRSSQHIQSLL
jgi:NTE family protein